MDRKSSSSAGEKDGISNITKCSLTKEEESLFYAHKLMYHKNLMIEQCNGWLSEEEGYKNIQNQDFNKINRICKI